MGSAGGDQREHKWCVAAFGWMKVTRSFTGPNKQIMEGVAVAAFCFRNLHGSDHSTRRHGQCHGHRCHLTHGR